MRVEIKVSGIVQGVGFRPFVYRVAVENGLVGYVRNRGDAVVEIVEENGFKFLVHNQVPPRGGGMSFGQVVVAAF